MKKMLILAAIILLPASRVSAQDLVEQNRAAVKEAQDNYDQTFARSTRKIEELQAGLSVNEKELSRLQNELKIAKAKEQHIAKTLKLNQQKLNLERKSGSDQLSRDITKNNIENNRNELAAAKETRLRLSREVATMKSSVASDKKRIAAAKKEIAGAKKTLRLNEKVLKDSEKAQAAALK